MIPIADIVDTDALLQVVWVSLAAGIGVTLIYAVAIVGVSRATDLSRDGRTGEAILLGIIGAVAFAVVIASVVFGVVVMTTK